MISVKPISAISVYTGKQLNYNYVTTWIDGTAMTDAKCDGVIYRKFVGGLYGKVAIPGSIDVEEFGAVGDGVTDDTLAIQRACTLLTSIATNQRTPTLRLNSIMGYSITNTITVNGNLNFENKSKIWYNGTSNKTGIQFLNAIACKIELSIQGVPNADMSSNLFQGVVLNGLTYCEVDIKRSVGFTRGVICESDSFATGFGWNKIKLGRIYNCQDGFVIRGTNDGWLNANLVVGGSFGNSGGQVNFATISNIRSYLKGEVSITSQSESWVFMNQQFEGGILPGSGWSTYETLCFNFQNSRFGNFKFIDYREEATNAVRIGIITTGSLNFYFSTTQNTNNNIILMDSGWRINNDVVPVDKYKWKTLPLTTSAKPFSSPLDTFEYASHILNTSGTCLNYTDYLLDQYNKQSKVWVGKSIAGSSGSDGGVGGAFFLPDITKLYRFTFFVQAPDDGVSGSIYCGINSGSVQRPQDSVPYGTAYFGSYNRLTTLFKGQWVMIVGYVHPAGTIQANCQKSRAYLCSTGVDISSQVAYANDSNYLWCWLPTGQPSSTYIQSFQSSVGAGAQINISDMRIDVCDGSEPNIVELLGKDPYAINLATTPLQGPTANRPTSPLIGTQYYDINVGGIVVWTGTVWQVDITTANLQENIPASTTGLIGGVKKSAALTNAAPTITPATSGAAPASYTQTFEAALVTDIANLITEVTALKTRYEELITKQQTAGIQS